MYINEIIVLYSWVNEKGRVELIILPPSRSEV